MEISRSGEVEDSKVVIKKSGEMEIGVSGEVEDSKVVVWRK